MTDKTSDVRRREAVANLIRFLRDGGPVGAILDGPSEEFTSRFSGEFAAPFAKEISNIHQSQSGKNNSDYDFASFWVEAIYDNRSAKVLYSDPEARQALEDELFRFVSDVFWDATNLTGFEISQPEMATLEKILARLEEDLKTSLYLAGELERAFLATPLQRKARNVFSGVMGLSEGSERIERIRKELATFPKSKGGNFRGSSKERLPLCGFLHAKLRSFGATRVFL